MKTKTLIGMAVASTFGWSAATFAGTGHEVVTPFSPNESAEVLTQFQSRFGSKDPVAIGSTFDRAGGTLEGSMTRDGSASLHIPEPSASLGESGAMDESLVLGDEGIYSDYYVVGLAPIDAWDYYVIDADPLSAAEEMDFLMPSYDIVWVNGELFADDSMLVLESGD